MGMLDNRIFDMEAICTDDCFDYVEYSVNSWREWIGKVMNELDKIDSVQIKILTYFSVLEMMEQEFLDFPQREQQNSFTEFVLKFQNKYDFLTLTDPITLYYRVEDIISSKVSLDDLGNASHYSPKDDAIRLKTEEIKKALTEIKGEDFTQSKMKQHRYVDLLYRMRCRLSHEFSTSHITYNRTAEEPYYTNCYRDFIHEEKRIEDEVWQLMFPPQFIKDLCLNCFENYLAYCTENHTPPNKHNSLGRFCELSWYNR